MSDTDMMRKAWRVEHFRADGVGVVWAATRSKARHIAASGYCEVFNRPYIDGLMGMRVTRAPMFDHLDRGRRIIGLEHAEHELTEETDV